MNLQELINNQDKAKYIIVNPSTCKRFDECVVECNPNESVVTYLVTETVWDTDLEEDVLVAKKEPDQRFGGPGTKWVPKLQRRYCDFDVVERETGIIVAEARYFGASVL